MFISSVSLLVHYNAALHKKCPWNVMCRYEVRWTLSGKLSCYIMYNIAGIHKFKAWRELDWDWRCMKYILLLSRYLAKSWANLLRHSAIYYYLGQYLLLCSRLSLLLLNLNFGFRQQTWKKRQRATRFIALGYICSSPTSTNYWIIKYFRISNLYGCSHS